MAKVQPFHGVRYNKTIARDLSAVICPPYDIITPQMEENLYRYSPYNFIRIEHGKKLPQDSTMDNKYTRSANTLEEWLKQEVFVTDEKPAIYLHDQHFIYGGKEYKRRHLLARVGLEEWHKNIIRPHEGTLANAKSDRISLLWALKANTSPILSMFEDSEQYIAALIHNMELGEPEMDFETHDSERHRVWAITDEKALNDISNFFAEKPLYIADGHHRYESALIYQREQKTIHSSAPEDSPFNYTLMSLVDFDDPGMVILPPHRLIRGLPSSSMVGLEEKLETFFNIEEMPLNLPGIWKRVDNLLADDSEIRLFLYGIKDDSLLLLTLKDFASASNMMPYFHSEIYKRMDVSIVDHVILEELLGLSSEDEVKISYNYDSRDAVKQVKNQEHQLAFIISPIPSRRIKEISDVGDRMPRKSTYFYPKLPSGLVINRLV